MAKHQVSCNVAGCFICKGKPHFEDIYFFSGDTLSADTTVSPCLACVALRREVERLREELYKDHNNNFEGHECGCADCEQFRRREGKEGG